MVKYLLGLIAGMSIVPFAYMIIVTENASPKFYFATLIIPSLIVGFTALAAKKLFNPNVL